MKKSLVAVSVIVVLGAAWTGASWYTGKQIQQHMDQVMDNANSQLSTYNAGLKLSITDYQRGLFSSRVHMTLRSANANKNAADATAAQTPEEISVIETIDHGPFPTTQLKKLNLLPSMASVHSELVNNATVKPLFDLTQGKSLISVDTRIAYNGNTTSSVQIIPVSYDKDGTKINFSGGSLDLELSQDLQSIKIDSNIDNLTINTATENGQAANVTLSGVSLKGDSHMGKFQIGMGNQELAIKQLAVKSDDKQNATINGLKISSQSSENDKTIASNIIYSFDSLNVLGNDFGSSKLSIKLENLDGQAIKQVSETYHQQFMNMVRQGNSENLQAEQQILATAIESTLPAFLKANPVISIAPFSWKNAKGESTFNVSVTLKDGYSATTPAKTMDEQLARFVSKIDAKLNIPVDMASEVSTQMAKLQGASGADAEKAAKEQVQALAAMGQMFKVTTLKNEVISSSFHYSDNQVELNGQKMSLPELMQMFGGLGGGQQEESLQPQEQEPQPQQPAEAQGNSK
jgi:uncharacterized protein YdgA (DUF945 family)